MSPPPPGRAEVRRDLAVIFATAALLFLPALGARDLWHPNEPTYGKAVVEMAQRGEWLVPTVNDAAFAEKPILWFWLARVSSAALGGVSELSLRVPSALAGILGVLLLYLLVLPLAGRSRAGVAAALYATTFGVFWNARAIQMDLLVAVSTLAVVRSVVLVVDRDAPAMRGWMYAGAAAGLGFLAKGPVAWICPAIVLGTYLMATGRIHRIADRAVIAGAAVCLAIVLPWIALVVGSGQTEVLREMFFRQNVTRFLEPWDHAAPWWYYLEYVWIDFAPWAWLLPFAVALPERDEEERRLDLLAWCWLAAVVVFFSLSGSKRSPYILPAAPAVAILAAGVVERFLDHRLTSGRRRGVSILLATLGGIAIAGGCLVGLRVGTAYPEYASAASAVALLLVAGGVAIVSPFFWRRQVPAACAAFFALITCTYLLAAVVVLPAVNSRKSARPFCDKVRALAEPEAQIASFKFWGLRASYGYYLGRTIPNLSSEEALRRYFSDERPVFLIVETPRLDEARAVIGPREPLARAEIGGQSAFLFSNR